MYIAFKWLIILAVAMWAMLCSIDMLGKKKNNEIRSTDFIIKPSIYPKNGTFKALSPDQLLGERLKFTDTQQSISLLHYLTFLAGALAVTLYNRKSEIILFTKNKIIEINFRSTTKQTVVYLNKTAIRICVAMLKKIKIFWEKSKRKLLFLKMPSLQIRGIQNQHPMNSLLFKRLKEVGQERNNLGQLLIAAIQENKNIRLQWQLENLAKNRLLRQIQDTHKQIKDNRSRYVSFQQLYLITHQENIFLKSRIKKLSKSKEEAENNLMLLVNRIYRSKDSSLKAYCAGFIVKTQENLMNSDVNAEIQTYLEKTRRPDASTSNFGISGRRNFDLNTTRSWPDTRSNVRCDDVVSCVDEEQRPKLRGLPGEYVWTVKDKDGIIEKLYEYDYGYNFDNGDTIRRIRQYSVYHDKDCLLDFKNSRSTTIFHEKAAHTEAPAVPKNMPMEFPANRNFLTGSPMFQQFLENNKNVVMTRTMAPAPPLLCG